jgi:hypothetical protein
MKKTIQYLKGECAVLQKKNQAALKHSKQVYQEMVETKDKKIVELQDANHRVRRKSGNQKTELRNLQRCLLHLKRKRAVDKMKYEKDLHDSLGQKEMLKETIEHLYNEKEELVDQQEEMILLLNHQKVDHRKTLATMQMELVESCMENKRKDHLLAQAEAKLLKSEERTSFLEVLSQLTQENEQEVWDELDNVYARLTEEEDRNSILEDKIQQLKKKEQEKRNKLLELEAEKNLWMDKCLNLQGPSSGNVQTSAESMTSNRGKNMVSSEIPVSQEEVLDYKCSTVELVTPQVIVTSLEAETSEETHDTTSRIEDTTPLCGENAFPTFIEGQPPSKPKGKLLPRMGSDAPPMKPLETLLLSEEEVTSNPYPTTEMVTPSPLTASLESYNESSDLPPKIKSDFPSDSNESKADLLVENKHSTRMKNGSPSRFKRELSSRMMINTKTSVDGLSGLLLTSEHKTSCRDKENPWKQIPLSRKKRRSLSALSYRGSQRRLDSRGYTIIIKPGSRRDCCYRREWYRDKMAEVLTEIQLDIDNTLTDVCCTLKQICETFRPKVEEVMGWVVNSPFLSQYDHPAKCILFQEVLRVKIADGGSVKDVVALWCDGHGARDPSWGNLLICLEESYNDGLQRVAHFCRVQLIECLPGVRLTAYACGRGCIGCGQQSCGGIAYVSTHAIEESTTQSYGQRHDPDGST